MKRVELILHETGAKGERLCGERALSILGNLCYTFVEAAGSVSTNHPSVFLPQRAGRRGKGRMEHDLGVHMTQCGALHGLHPEGQVRFSVRPKRAFPDFPELLIL